jgi:hypothetical protein
VSKEGDKMKKIISVALVLITILGLLCSCGKAKDYDSMLQSYVSQGYEIVGGVEAVRSKLSGRDPLAKSDILNPNNKVLGINDVLGSIQIFTGTIQDLLTGSGAVVGGVGVVLFNPSRGALLKHTQTQKLISLVEFSTEEEATDYLSRCTFIGITYEQVGKVVTFEFSGRLYY